MSQRPNVAMSKRSREKALDRVYIIKVVLCVYI